MHRALSARWLNRALSIGEASAPSSVPLFLCPAVGAPSRVYRTPRATPLQTPVYTRRFNHAQATTTQETPVEPVESAETPSLFNPEVPRRKLPLNCTGCGAFTQTNDPQLLGYFDPESKRVKKWLNPRAYERQQAPTQEDEVVGEVLKILDRSQMEALGMDPSLLISGAEREGHVAPKVPPQEKQPVCDRCHDLQHYSTKGDTAKVPMYHPTVESLRETIEESPHKYNHIYHVIDAADFPMSLIPRLNVLLGDIPIRTRNRRSRSSKFQHDRKTELSFIITRGDLLGPKKEIVDTMMPYLREVLRDALGRLGNRVRLGNVRCVSARRSWWCKEVKEDIWRRGGAGWMVGKVNVGKSQLFEAVYPKGRMGPVNDKDRAAISTYPREVLSAESIAAQPIQDKDVDVGDLLPPLQPAQNYPDMPLVSSLPGTTASPIRVPFGNGKGELVDLPGLARSDLELFVREDARQSTIMKKRIVPEQISMTPGKSLILGGGLIRITPKNPNLVILAYNFTPLEEHLTQTDKAIAFQEQTRESAGVPSIMLPGIGDKMKHAGTFKLSHDVTRKRAGPLTRKNAIGLNVDRLPFRVLSTDILIEGVGYVELVAQVRARDVALKVFDQQQRQTRADENVWKKPVDTSDPFAAMKSQRRDTAPVVQPRRKEPEPPLDPGWPAVDVFSPEGRFIGSRQPIHGWLNNKPRVLKEHKKSRPRRSMKGAKKKDKVERRAAN
ncbi:hypothetical protein FSPOR_10958 [Fusarium sporotrichioides]|uniref:Genetic interactor of prohibitins 3, mitochondrial n=1 Tax=Fusarium sporotrichioides TaxID=5514 RepID=A0A395RJA9_FUSSP|nr:hypothetical protein FSPOR_10958 [Fusarium sporotrichioides]